MDAEAAQVARLYDTMFDRAPDLAGLAFWKTAVEQGYTSLAGVAAAMTESPEFHNLYGNQTGDTQLVALLYRNTLNREGSAEEINYYVNRLNEHSLDRNGTILAFSESAEHQQLTHDKVLDSHGIVFA